MQTELNAASTDADIVAYYDTHWSITLAQLSDMTGKPVAYLKRLLLGE